MKVIYTVVVLLSLLAFFNVAYSAPTCGDNGVQDSYATSFCNCFSGYAPTNSAQSNCDDFVGCPAHETKDTGVTLGSYPPFLYSAGFVADHYNTDVRVPLVVGRRNVTVRIAGGENTCGYPGSLWKKQVNKADCIDEIIGSIPWSSHAMCGFTASSSGIMTTYNATLQVAYDDFVDGSIRTTGITLKVSVTFVTQVSVIYSLVNMNAGNTLVTVAVVGSLVYDSNSQLAAVTVKITTSWPYTAAAVAMSSTPYPNTATIAPDTFFDVSSNCNSQSGSKCVQQYVIQINPTTGCNLGGSYAFNITLSCRGNLGSVCSGTYPAGAYSIFIYDTDICGVGGVNVALSTGSLLPFSDAAGNLPASSFTPNQWVYFSFVVTSDAATITGLVVEKIFATANSNNDVLFDLQSTTYAGITPKGTAAGLVITNTAGASTPGTSAILWFRVQLVNTINSFQVLPGSATAVTMSIIVDVQYQGNSRRMVLTSESSSPLVTASTGATDIYISEAASDSTEGNNVKEGASAGYQLNALSSTFFSVFAALFVVYVVRR